MKTGKVGGTTIVVLGMGICAAGCGTSRDVQTIDVSDNTLGVSKIEIERTTTGGDSLLTVHGMNAEDQEVAGATLRTGSVMYSYDSDLASPQPTTGRELIVWAGDDKTTPMVVPNLVAFQVPTPWDGAAGEFVALAPVADVLATEGKLSFTPSPGAGEAAYSASSCSGAIFPTGKAAPPQCCVEGGVAYFQIASSAKLSEAVAGLACSDDGHTHSTCNGMTCAYGPCGNYQANPGGTGTATAHVFHPTAAAGGDAHCGRDDNGGIQYPEVYSNQTVYGSVTPTCTNSWCVSGNAVYGQNVLSLYLDDGGWAYSYVTTNLSSYPSLGGTGAAYYMYAYYATDPPYQGYYSPTQQVTLTAYPNGAKTTTWEGPCQFSVTYPTTTSQCTITMSQAQSQYIYFTYY